jgi:hypothetical protein
MMRFARPAAIGAIAVLGCALALTPRPAQADAQQQQNFSIWHQMDECAKQAFKQYPDHTPEGNAKREAARQACLRAHRLPVNQPVAPPPPPSR